MLSSYVSICIQLVQPYGQVALVARHQAVGESHDDQARAICRVYKLNLKANFETSL
jgi:hypothetical protein